MLLGNRMEPLGTRSFEGEAGSDSPTFDSLGLCDNEEPGRSWLVYAPPRSYIDLTLCDNVRSSGAKTLASDLL